MIVGHRDALGIERVGFDDIGTRLQVFAMNVLNDMRSRETQEVVVTLHLSGLLHESSSTELFFREVVFLYHGSQCTVQYQDALTNQVLNSLHSYQRLNIRSISRRSSFSLMDWRLSYCFLPLAKAMTNLANPFSLMKRRVGTIVKPGFFSAS